MLRVYKQSGTILIGTDCEVFVIHCTCQQVRCSNGASSKTYQFFFYQELSWGSFIPVIEVSRPVLVSIETCLETSFCWILVSSRSQAWKSWSRSCALKVLVSLEAICQDHQDLKRLWFKKWIFPKCKMLINKFSCAVIAIEKILSLALFIWKSMQVPSTHWFLAKFGFLSNLYCDESTTSPGLLCPTLLGFC